jgi:outer membrane protein assembly factor BamB
MTLSIPLFCKKSGLHFKLAASILAIMPMWLVIGEAVPATGQTSGTPSSPGDWTQFLGDNMQRWDPYETVLGVNNVGSLQLKWTQSNSLPYVGFGNPVVANGVAYFGGGEDENYLYAVDASTGQPLWTYTLADGGYGVASTPAVANGVVYFATFVDTVVYALNAKTGVKLWSFGAARSSAPSDITVADGVVYVGGGAQEPGGALYALDAGTGAVLWSFAGSIASTPAVAIALVYFDVLGGFSGDFGASYNDVLAVNAHTGKVLWDYFIPGPGYPGVSPTSSTVVANGVVYFSAEVGASFTNNVYAVNANTGKTLWVYKVPDQTASGTPAVANGALYIAAVGTVSPGGTVYALSATTGKQLYFRHRGTFYAGGREWRGLYQRWRHRPNHQRSYVCAKCQYGRYAVELFPARFCSEFAYRIDRNRLRY